MIYSIVAVSGEIFWNEGSYTMIEGGNEQWHRRIYHYTGEMISIVIVAKIEEEEKKWRLLKIISMKNSIRNVKWNDIYVTNGIIVSISALKARYNRYLNVSNEKIPETVVWINSWRLEEVWEEYSENEILGWPSFWNVMKAKIQSLDTEGRKAVKAEGEIWNNEDILMK